MMRFESEKPSQILLNYNCWRYIQQVISQLLKCPYIFYLMSLLDIALEYVVDKITYISLLILLV